jgi:hypothetical protein
MRRKDVPRPPGQKLGPKALDLADWRDERVGWGLVLLDRDDVPAAAKSRGDDAPEPVRALLASRPGSPVLRYRADLPSGYLRRYWNNGKSGDLRLTGERGTADNAVPRYLLIVASPADLPWREQCRWQTDAYVGRLDLDPPGLERYVGALLTDWNGAAPKTNTPVLWAVDHGHPDITRLMRRSIADRLKAAFDADPDHEFDVSQTYLTDAHATRAELMATLAARNPAFVVTSSHGATYPLDDVAAMQQQLGLPVDNDRALLGAEALVAAWPAHGAIWYAHACCSAGSDGASRFAGLVTAGSSLALTLAGISACGSMTSPLPRALLGGAAPARAFIGHVEPTFDWTLRNPVTGQVTTHHIVETLYQQLHLASRPPIGLAMETYYKAVGGLLQDYADALDGVDAHEAKAIERAREAKLLALDRLGMVLLGDPTVALAPRSTGA